MSIKTQEILIKANTIFKNITDNAAAKTLLAEYSYNDAKLAAGVALFEAARGSTEKNMNEYSQQYAATASFHELRKASKKIYVKHSTIARVALADTRVAYNQLGLRGPRGTSFAKLSEQTARFYTNALASSAILASLATFGLTEAKLSAGQAALVAAQEARAKQQREMTEAVGSTAARNQAIDDLSRWISAFLATAHIALEEHPEVYATLGV